MVVEVLVGRSRRDWSPPGDIHVSYRHDRLIHLKGDPTVAFGAVYGFESVRFRLMFNQYTGGTVPD